MHQACLEAPEEVTGRTTKRAAENEEHAAENPTPPKKPRTPVARDGILKGRPILKDVLNGDQ